MSTNDRRSYRQILDSIQARAQIKNLELQLQYVREDNERLREGQRIYLELAADVTEELRKAQTQAVYVRVSRIPANCLDWDPKFPDELEVYAGTPTHDLNDESAIYVANINGGDALGIRTSWYPDL